MEHLPLPHNPASIPPRVPYVCKDSPYDEGDFMTYPVRAGWPCVIQREGDKLNWTASERLKPSDDKLLESFLQSWLFFGLLHHVLAPVQLYSAEDYILSEGESLYVHTTNLEDKLSSWLGLVRALPSDSRARIVASLAECLKLAHTTFLVSTLPSHRGFDRSVKLGLGALFETVEEAVHLAGEGNMDMLSVAPNIDEKAKDLMISNGWCPAESAAAANDFCSFAGRIYLQNMRKSTKVGIDHGNCTHESCGQTQIDLATYRPRHVTESCDCELLGPEIDDVMACLAENSFPLLKINSMGDLDVQPFRPDMQYVALSHVWADGLGNPHEMTLPRCQTLKLRGLLTGIRQQTFRHGDEHEQSNDQEELYLWCDSLCCPTKQPGKAVAMVKLREVYQKSTYVLVLDSTLEHFKYSEMDQLEAMMRVLTSKWNRRLWTYQEAGLTRKLLVQFGDGPIDFKHIWTSVRLELTDRIVGRYLYRVAAFGGSVLRTLFNQTPNLTHRIEDVEFAMAIRGICYRRVSVQTDEALCLAAVFDLDMEAVLQEEPGSRMEMVWSLMAKGKRGIPESTIFNEQPRLTSIGYRWAPATLQQSVTGIQHSSPRGDRYVGATILRHGLPVSRPGFRIQLAGPPPYLSKNFSPAMSPEHLLSRLRDPSGRWLNILMMRYLLPGTQPSLLTLLQDRERDWHIILEDSFDRQGPSQRTALLAYRDHHDSGLEFFRSSAIVSIAYQDPEWNIPLEGTYHSAVALRKIWPLRLLIAGHKCEMVLSAILAWFPTLLRLPVVATLRKMFVLVGRAIARRTAARIERQAESISKIPKIAAWMEYMNAKRGTAANDVDDIKAVILPIFMGRVATVLQEFGPEQQWFVD